MERIELFGLPRVGKTTLLKEIVNSKTGFISEDIFKKIYLYTFKRNYLTDKLIYKSETANKITLRSMNAVGIAESVKYNSSRAFHLLENDELLKTIHNLSFSGERSEARKLFGIYKYVDRWYLVDKISKYDSKYKILLDEGLYQRIFSISEVYHSNNRELIKMFFELQPPPKAVIFCKLDPEITLERVLKTIKEGKQRPFHEKISNFNSLLLNQNEIIKIANVFFAESNVPYLNIDMANNSHENIAKIRLFLNNTENDIAGD